LWLIVTHWLQFETTVRTIILYVGYGSTRFNYNFFNNSIFFILGYKNNKNIDSIVCVTV
jgi:hypothetical protein